MIDEKTFGTRRALYVTFGCKLNFAETSTVARLLGERGFSRVQKGERPDMIVVNTCSVTEMADKKCRQTIRSLSKRYPGVPVVVTGCYAQLKSEEAAGLPGVAIVAGSDQKLRLMDYIDQWEKTHEPQRVVTATKDIRTFDPSCSRGDRTRYFLKVQDGCDYYCSYCTIPYARGRSRSGSIASLVEQARGVAAEGGREIVLTGVNIGDFGKGTSETFLDLIKALDAVEGIERYRISSIEPNLLSDEIIEWVASSRRFMPHFHIPLQAGDDEVLRLMRRHYDTELFAHRIATIRRLIPDAFIGVDVIAGARGETPERWERGLEFIKGLDISRLHVFPYSERPGTRALEIDYVVDAAEKQRRTHQLLRLSEEKLEGFTQRFMGQTRPMLVEHTVKEGRMSGFTDNYLRVSLPADPQLANRVVMARLTEPTPDG